MSARLLPAVVVMSTLAAAAGGAQHSIGTGVEMASPADPRDPARVATGTAVISGRVIGGDTGRPLRRAQVRLFGEGLPEGRMASTDEYGRYELEDLPGGRFMLMAAKGGYVTATFGQRRVTDRARPLNLEPGQQLRNVDFTLPRGGVVSGRITDEAGEPVPNIQVQALQYRYMNGRRTLFPGNSGRPILTDDLGRFRLFGLSPGSYYISASNDPSESYGAVPWDTNDWVVRTYYPGTASAADAQRVQVEAGRETPSIHFALSDARPSAIRGTVIDSRGQPAGGGYMMVLDTENIINFGGHTAIGPDGSFIVRHVSPGDYVLYVSSGGDTEESGIARVSVTSADLEGLTIVTAPPTVISGQVLFETEPLKPVTPGQLRFLAAAAEPVSPIQNGQIIVNDDWTFEARVREGPVLIRAEMLPDEWTLNAVLHGGVDVTDSGIGLGSGRIVDGVQIVLSNRMSVLSGTATDASGRRAENYTVVVFADDPRDWNAMSRKLFLARSADGGRYEIPKIPPGHYLAAAVADVEDGQHRDPDYLERLRAYATPVEIREGQRLELTLEVVRPD